MVLEMDRDPGAITLGSDPYLVIRPEGRWHLPSVLEKSAARPHTRPIHKASSPNAPVSKSPVSKSKVPV
jgi:hypothetical protein